MLPAPPVVVNGYAGGDLLNGDADGGLLNADSVLAGEKKNGLVTEILENNIDCQLPQFVNGDDGEDGCIDEKDESELNSSEEECAGANVRNLAGTAYSPVLLLVLDKNEKN